MQTGEFRNARMNDYIKRKVGKWEWFLRNVWIGISVENQKRYDERIPFLLQTNATVRYISFEPLLENIDLKLKNMRPYLFQKGEPYPGIDWVIIGGESGKGARQFNVPWARSIIAQCKEAGIPVFMKQVGKKACDYARGDENLLDRLELKHPKGGDPMEWPEDIRIREYPK
jgi:protein gp37